MGTEKNLYGQDNMVESASINITMSDTLFKQFSEFIYEECGIKLSFVKKTMLTVRLFKRLRALDMKSFDQYYDYVHDSKNRHSELVQMIDVVSTNKTDFFREPAHFVFLQQQVLPELACLKNNAYRRKLNIWSAGCSSGEEPYTLAMVLSEFFTRSFDNFSILATDISTRVLEKAKKAIYSTQIVEPVPDLMKKKYLMRGIGLQKDFCRVVPELRSRISFQRLNFMEKSFKIKTSMDIIFCRNVIIYFDQQTQKRLFKKLYDQLIPGGYLFIGHSESLHGINNDFYLVGSTIYRKPE